MSESSRLIIRPIQKDEIEEAAMVMQHAFGDKGDFEIAQREFQIMFSKDTFRPTVLGSFLCDKIVGVVAFIEDIMSTDLYSIFWVGTHPDYQNRGIATQLIQHAKSMISEEMLSGRAGDIILTTKHPEFYERLGFERSHFKTAHARYVMLQSVNTN